MTTYQLNDFRNKDRRKLEGIEYIELDLSRYRRYQILWKVVIGLFQLLSIVLFILCIYWKSFIFLLFPLFLFFFTYLQKRIHTIPQESAVYKLDSYFCLYDKKNDIFYFFIHNDFVLLKRNQIKIESLKFNRFKEKYTIRLESKYSSKNHIILYLTKSSMTRFCQIIL